MYWGVPMDEMRDIGMAYDQKRRINGGKKSLISFPTQSLIKRPIQWGISGIKKGINR
jgi:hypothetical protein